jgi:hypothetical protein
MKYLKKYKVFNEDGDATVGATTAGMGDVSNAQPGVISGTTGTTGSGDVTFTFKKEKRKKGGPSQVSDLRDLKDVKTDKVEDIKESYNLTKEEESLIKDCLIELVDMGFEINDYKIDNHNHEYDIDDDNVGNFKSQEIRISLSKQVKKIWRGNLQLRYSFDKNNIYDKKISTLRPHHVAQDTILNGNPQLDSYESEISDITEDVCNKLVNHLEYDSGKLEISFNAGEAINWNKERQINININIVLNRNIYPVDESYNNEQEYITDIIDQFKSYNIRPIVLNDILDFYSDEITDNYNNDKQPKDFVDMIVNDMNLDSGGFMSQKMGSQSWNNKVIKYL